MELRHLRYFLAVAEERSFTRGAERLHVAQPPLSRQIRDLETELGSDLFDRSARPLRLTEAGRLLFEQASRVTGSVDQLHRTMRALISNERRLFVIGFVGSTIYGPMPRLIRRFREITPDVDVRLLELTTLEQIAALKEGRIDAGIGRLRLADPAVHSEVLVEEPLVAALSLDHPLANRPETVRLAELAHEPLIIYPSRPRPSYADQVLQLFRDAGIQPRQVEEAREVQTALGLVAAGFGLAVVPHSLNQLRRADVTFRPLEDKAAVSPVILSWRMADQSIECARFVHIAREFYDLTQSTAGPG